MGKSVSVSTREAGLFLCVDLSYTTEQKVLPTTGRQDIFEFVVQWDCQHCNELYSSVNERRSVYVEGPGQREFLLDRVVGIVNFFGVRSRTNSAAIRPMVSKSAEKVVMPPATISLTGLSLAERIPTSSPMV